MILSLHTNTLHRFHGTSQDKRVTCPYSFHDILQMTHKKGKVPQREESHPKRWAKQKEEEHSGLDIVVVL